MKDINIYSPKGTKVRFTGKGGWAMENQRANEKLTVGRVYTIEYTEVHSWFTDVILQEVPGMFNSVMFEEV